MEKQDETTGFIISIENIISVGDISTMSLGYSFQRWKGDFSKGRSAILVSVQKSFSASGIKYPISHYSLV
jgi:hypothetical protein